MDFAKEARELTRSIERIGLSLDDHMTREIDYGLDRITNGLEDLRLRLEKADSAIMKSCNYLSSFRSDTQKLSQRIEDLTSEDICTSPNSQIR